MRSLRSSHLGNAALYGILAVVALIVVLVALLLFPQYVLGILIVLVAALVFYVGKGSPYGLATGFGLVVLAIILILLAPGQSLSLSVVHGL
ncbi:MAG: hypothetical protein KGI98_12080 [Euryarchaeota archaeon]|nr:hypothetical protein [Euryarchaeota archaeon]MDE1881208.1 hypothetical protein [Euryarchaeota archaeon]